MAYTEKLSRTIVVLDLNPDGTLSAANVERRYDVARDGVLIGSRIDRDVLVAADIAGVMPDQAALLLRVQKLEEELAAREAEIDGYRRAAQGGL